MSVVKPGQKVLMEFYIYDFHSNKKINNFK
jgi:hypothetical protein